MSELSRAINEKYTVSYGYAAELDNQIAKAAQKYARVIEYIAPVCLEKIADDKTQLQEYIINNIAKELAEDVPDCVQAVAKVFAEYLDEALEVIKGKPFEIIEGERYINGNGDLFELGFVLNTKRTHELTDYPYIMKEFDEDGCIWDSQTFTKSGKFYNDPDFQHWNLTGIYWEGVK